MLVTLGQVTIIGSDHPNLMQLTSSSDGLVAISSASHAEGRGFDPRSEYFLVAVTAFGISVNAFGGCSTKDIYSIFHFDIDGVSHFRDDA